MTHPWPFSTKLLSLFANEHRTNFFFAPRYKFTICDLSFCSTKMKNRSKDKRINVGADTKKHCSIIFSWQEKSMRGVISPLGSVCWWINHRDTLSEELDSAVIKPWRKYYGVWSLTSYSMHTLSRHNWICSFCLHWLTLITFTCTPLQIFLFAESSLSMDWQAELKPFICVIDNEKFSHCFIFFSLCVFSKFRQTY